MLGTAKTDDDGRATFTPGLTRGDGGMVPAVLMASEAQTRLRLPRHEPRRLRPVGPRRRRTPGAGRARRLCLDRARHLPRRRDTSMSARLPATRRPRPSRTCRSPSSSRGRTASRTAASSATASRPAAMPSTSTLAENAMRGTWQVGIYTDPKKAAGRHADVPGRGLRAGPHRVRPVAPTRRRSARASSPT